jgi:maltose O-acetyltransferase
VSRQPDQTMLPGARVPEGEAAGARPRGVAGWTSLLRRRVRSRLHGTQDVDRLIAQGLSVGRDVFIADGAYLDPGFPWLISIGDETTIGPGVTILAHDAAPKLRTGYSMIARVHVGARVFVGANAIILPGVTIADDAVVGAGTVVRRDVARGTIVIGNPAQEVGTTAAHTERHRAQMKRRPRYPVVGDPDAAQRRRMLEELGEGPSYVG